MSRRLPLACLLLVALCVSAQPTRADHQSVHVGVLLEGSDPSLLSAWQPLRAALNARVRDHEFELVPLAFDTFQQVVERGEVDFVIVDPAVYATLELRDDVSRIATRLQRENGRDLSRLATLLFTRNDRVDLSRAQDLVDARLAAVHPDSFAGWHLATYTLAGHGADPKELLESAAFTNFDFAAVAQLVAEGRADAGVLPSGVFEQLVERGLIEPARFKILGQRQIPISRTSTAARCSRNGRSRDCATPPTTSRARSPWRCSTTASTPPRRPAGPPRSTTTRSTRC